MREMDYIIHQKNGKEIVEISTNDLFITSTQDMLDVMANVPSNIIVLKKEMVHESFFELKSGLAGEILQKLSNYFVKLAIAGDYSGYNSKSLKDFIYESNKRNQVIFVNTVEEAIERLSKN